MTTEQKQQFADWLINNLKITSVSNVELIIAHVDHYFCPATTAALPVQNFYDKNEVDNWYDFLSGKGETAAQIACYITDSMRLMNNVDAYGLGLKEGFKLGKEQVAALHVNGLDEIKEQARQYAESCMYSKSWDKNDAEMVGRFYKYFIDKLIELLPVNVVDVEALAEPAPGNP